MKNKILLLLFTIIATTYTSCTDLTEVEDRLNILEQEVIDIKDAIKVLQSAYENGKIIKSVEPLENPNDGWVITFTDGNFIELKNGVSAENGTNGINGTNGTNGVTPYLLIDQDGYWCISNDNGNTFTRMMDNSGKSVKAKGDKGDKGDEGISIKVIIDNDGYYVFNMYYASEPNSIIDTIKTPYQSNPSKVISSIIQDEATNIIIITLEDGSSYEFNKDYATPTSIAILTTSGVKLGTGTTSTLEFRVNPSNAKFNYDVNDPLCNINLDLVNKTKSSYVTVPTNYKLTKVEQVYNEQGIIRQGQYRAYITDSNISNNYIEDATLVLSVNNKNNEDIQISSSAIQIKYQGNIISSFSFLKKNNEGVIYDVNATINDNQINACTPLVTDVKKLVATFTTNGEKVLVNNIEQISGVTSNDFTNPITYTIISANGETNQYTVSVSNTGLPLVIIETPNNATIPPKTADWLENTKIRILNSDGTVNYESEIDNIRGRGNSTWSYPKKPYAIKLNKKASILNMPKHKRWVLLANWMDRTMMRNRIAFKISQSTGLDWTPRGEFVEVVLNGKHVGNYYLCEQIKIDENRVNINEMEDTDIEGDAITGGYLMELDVYFDEVNKFKSSIKNLPYMFKEPDEDALNAQQFEYMKNYVNTLETALYDDDQFSTRVYENYLDINSFIDWWLVHELTRNCEPNHPKSSYMHKDKLGKLKAGPVWDFDWGTFTPTTPNLKIASSLYYDKLFQDSEFKRKVKERWAFLKADFLSITTFIDDEKNKLSKSADINIQLWPISSRENGDETLSFKEAVERMKTSYNNRIQALDDIINNM